MSERKRKTKLIALRLTPGELARIDAIAVHFGKLLHKRANRSEAMRACVFKGLDVLEREMVAALEGSKT